MTLRQLEAWKDEMMRREALRDLRMLDIIVAPHVDHDYFEKKRERLTFIVEHGYPPEAQPREPREELTEGEQRERNREALEALRMLTQGPQQPPPASE